MLFRAVGAVAFMAMSSFLGSFLADKITHEDIEGVLQKFTGNIMQVPPL